MYKRQLLVSGIMDNKMGESRLAHARGRVYAQVRERLEIFVTYEQRDYLLAVVARRWYLTVFGLEHLGDRSLAVTNIVRNVSGILVMVLMAFAATCGSLVSNLIGARCV